MRQAHDDRLGSSRPQQGANMIGRGCPGGKLAKTVQD